MRRPSDRALFQDERVTPAAITSLRETRVGSVVTLAPLEWEWGDNVAARGGGGLE